MRRRYAPAPGTVLHLVQVRPYIESKAGIEIAERFEMVIGTRI
jgi:hypothetical protein